MEAGSNADRTFWRFPWGYRHAGVLTVTLVSVGLVMQAVAPGASQRLPGWPWNSVLLLVFTGAVAVVRLIWLSRRSPVIRWLGSASVGVSALSALGLLGGLAAVIPQGEGHEFSGVWLHQIVGSWPFAFTVILLLLSLELAIVRRLIWPRWSDVPFFLNHVGVWLILAGMAFGGGDFRRLRVVLHESGADGGVTVSEGYDAGDSEQAKPLPLPFTLRLDGFLLQEYPPELVLIDNYSGEPVGGRAAKTLTAKTGAKGRLDSWNVTVTDFLPKAVPSGPLEYMTAGDRGGIAAAKLTAVGADGSRVEGWISVDRAFNLGDRSIAMTIPQPKLFHSDIVLDPGTAEERSLAVEVNHPGAAKGWRIYQSGYDPGQGKGTQVSILELIRDPWLPVVYSGIFMLLGGCLSLLGFGFKRRTAEESP